MTPLDYENSYDADLFDGYLAMLDDKLVRHELTREYGEFVEGDIPAAFWEVTRGIVGRASRLVRIAWEYAFSLGCPAVNRNHLAAAVDRWAFPLKLCRTNPFREGAKDFALVKDEWAKQPIADDAWERSLK